MPSLRPNDEFAPGASGPPSEMGRRQFLQLAGATATLASLRSCDRPDKPFVPPVTVSAQSPDPSREVNYASGLPWEGFARGVLVETHQGRPTKIEGNPRHRESGGATDAAMQAAIRDLYDPDRSRAPRERGGVASWEQFVAAWMPRRAALADRKGEGWAVVTEPTTSETVLAKIGEWKRRFPQARWYQHTALCRYDRAGKQFDFDPGNADVILAVGSDFLFRHPAALRYAKAFAARRRLEGGKARPNRLFALEAAWTVTGGMADVRLARTPSRWPAILDAIAGGAAAGLDADERGFAERVRRELAGAGERGLGVAGAEQPAAIQGRVERINRSGWHVPALRSDGHRECAGGLKELAAALQAAEVTDLFLLGVNPAYTAGRELRAPFTVHLGSHEDETAAGCDWHLPESHPLESWGDLRGYDGSQVILQPMIERRYASKSLLEVMHLIAEGAPADGYDLVRQFFSAADDDTWTGWLNSGLRGRHEKAESVSAAGAPRARGGATTPPSGGTKGDTNTAEATNAAGADPSPGGTDASSVNADRARRQDEAGGAPRGDESTAEIEVVMRADPFLGDGRAANNAWLQELPKPFTSLVWDNALWVSPGFASRAGLENGDVVRLSAGDRSVDAPIYVQKGVAEGCAIAELGGGRTRAGGAGNHRGFDVTPLRGPDADAWLVRARWAKTSQRVQLVVTQGHFSMEGRDVAHVRSYADAVKETRFEQPTETLFTSPPAGSPQSQHAWAMLIDLGTCLGCSACVAACQAENNTPSVGKEQASRGREMHWIRVDRYDSGEASVPQPVPCMQCERAPCELVCPVGATVHSSEGLNDMVYNRCVGTRYCSNNCPYKVRRFNFFDFESPAGSPLHLQENPEVTVRQRGVMEKCSYCVQRIDQGRIRAELEGRPVRDGEIRTACQQACPAEAIVFGDLADPESAVARRKREPTHYALLAELNTRPRTTYLARLRNA